MYKPEEFAIRIENLSKMYKIYNKPKDRILDVLGFGKLAQKNCQEFWALRDINLNIKKGSKVALVGRNGAGKSTLLKIISGNLKATSGEVTVNGKVSALMELGTGFHPEFTGAENIYASLSYMGIIGLEAKHLYEDIVEFSELEDFIHKPVKTYSAGMYARLAFSTSTTVVPEILIIDEILGAGDAYFINKSMERMKKLTDKGTTVLFVSHDIASVQKLCSEAIWIDRGKVILEGEILEVTAEYLASIRKQEELRLKAKNIRLKQNNAKSLEENIKENLIYVHLITPTGSPKSKHPISNIKLYGNNQLIEELLVGDAMDTSLSNLLFLIVDPTYINWSNPINDQKRNYRCYEDLGGKYQHALFAFKATLDDIQYKIEIEYQDISTEEVLIEYFDGEQYKKIGKFEAINDMKWKSNIFEVNEISQPEQLSQTLIEKYDEIQQFRTNNNRIYGSGEVVIRKVTFLDEDNHEALIFSTNKRKTIKIEYLALEKITDPIFVAAYYLLDGTCAMQLLSNKDNFKVDSIYGNGEIEIVLDPVLLGKGNYLVSIAIFKELSVLDNVEPSAYDLHDRLYEIKINQPFGINVDLGLINHPVDWRKLTDEG